MSNMQNMFKHSLLNYFILSFTLILIAVTRNKIVTKEACSTLLKCFFFQLKPSFSKSMIWLLCFFFKLYSLLQCYFLYSKDHVSVNLIFIRKVVHKLRKSIRMWKTCNYTSLFLKTERKNKNIQENNKRKKSSENSILVTLIFIL